MDDRYAQFLIAVGDLCAAAGLASLNVRARTAGGEYIVGVPAAVTPSRTGEEFDDSGYAKSFCIDARRVNLDEIVECTISAPSTYEGSAE